MIWISTVTTTTLYRTRHHEVSEEQIREIFGSVQSFQDLLEKSGNKLVNMNLEEDVMQQIEELLEDADEGGVERESKFDEGEGIYFGKIAKTDRHIEQLE
ncbi:hypothetical protein [Roseovarius sp.]|uniref:hypothetical protein n=1 Tax=Roseovarius sp. TaxID=1486281 RepID=UPI0026218861|nr:hypothetical protein [Roseovarius sp.]